MFYFKQKYLMTFLIENKTNCRIKECHKICIFPKGIVHGFDKKFDRFLPCVFMQNRPESV